MASSDVDLGYGSGVAGDAYRREFRRSNRGEQPAVRRGGPGRRHESSGRLHAALELAGIPPPGMKLVPHSVEARRWSRDLGLPFHEATIETNAHHISLVFSDLLVEYVGKGHVPFVVATGGPDFKYPIS